MSLLQIGRSFLYYRYLSSFGSRESLEGWQDKQVRRHLAWVRAHSPFYKRHFNGHALRDWKTLPEINKTLMMDNFDKLNTISINKVRAMDVALSAERTRSIAPLLNGVTVGLSSGTSGQRGLFLVSDSERYRWAGAMLAKMLPGILTHSERIALFLRSNSNLYTSIQSKRVVFRYFDLETTGDSLLEHLAQFQPTVLVAPPSMLRLLGQSKEEGCLVIAPRKVISVAEVLDPLGAQ